MEKRRIKLTVIEDTVQWTIIKFTDDGIIAIKKLNDLRSNEGHDEEELEEGDHCLAKYDDNEYYDAKILLITAKEKIDSTTKNKKQKKSKETREPEVQKENSRAKKKAEKPQEKKKERKKAETKTHENDEAKKKKKELAEFEKRKRETTAVSVQERATKLFASCSNLDVHVGSVNQTSQSNSSLNLSTTQILPTSLDHSMIYPVPLISSNPSPVPVISSNPSHVPFITSNPSPVPIISSNPSHVPFITSNPSPVPIISSNPPHVPLISSNPSPVPLITSNPSHLPLISSCPSPVPLISSNPSHVPPISSNPSHLPPISSNPSHLPLTSSYPSHVPLISTNPSTVSSDNSFSISNIQPLCSSTPSSNMDFFFEPSISTAISYSMGFEESPTHCQRCEANEITIRDLRIEITSLKNQVEALQANCSAAPELVFNLAETERDYYPKTRPRMKLAKYYTTDPVNPSIKEGYKQLAPGAPVVVDALWLHGTLSSVRGKDRAGSKKKPQKPETIIKHLMDGFFTIKDLVGKGGTSRFLDSPVYTSLKLYAEVVLKMCSASFNSAWNEKLSSARRTQKRLAAQEPSEGPSVGQ